MRFRRKYEFPISHKAPLRSSRPASGSTRRRVIDTESSLPPAPAPASRWTSASCKRAAARLDKSQGPFFSTTVIYYLLLRGEVNHSERICMLRTSFLLLRHFAYFPHSCGARFPAQCVHIGLTWASKPQAHLSRVSLPLPTHRHTIPKNKRHPRGTHGKE